jgi:hypothetical protein
MGVFSFLKYTWVTFEAHIATSFGAPFENHIKAFYRTRVCRMQAHSAVGHSDDTVVPTFVTRDGGHLFFNTLIITTPKTSDPPPPIATQCEQVNSNHGTALKYEDKIMNIRDLGSVERC